MQTYDVITVWGFFTDIYHMLARKYNDLLLQCVYWHRGHPDNENQSEGRTETIDSYIFKFSKLFIIIIIIIIILGRRKQELCKSATRNYIAWVPPVESLLLRRSKKALQMVCEQFHSNNFRKGFFFQMVFALMLHWFMCCVSRHNNLHKQSLPRFPLYIHFFK